MTDAIAGTNLTALMPIRLEIAARVMAAREADSESMLTTDTDDDDLAEQAKFALRYADALIKAHNETVG